MSEAVLGILGGSGLYDLPQLEDARWEVVKSPWGEPSDALRIGVIDGLKVVFLPRHGRAHRLAPSAINYRANIDILKRAGVTDLVSVSACGSFREDLPPGRFVLVDQFIDRTVAREKSFFGEGCVAHVPMAYPVSSGLMARLGDAAREIDVPVHNGGTYIAIEGPQFSTLAESKLYRQWGCDVIGMTNMPEAKLAREAEICYATIAMVTDYDCWHPDHGDVDITEILRVMKQNTEQAARLLVALARGFPKTHEPCPEGSDKVLDFAIITPPEARDPELMAKLDAVAGRVL